MQSRRPVYGASPKTLIFSVSRYHFCGVPLEMCTEAYEGRVEGRGSTGSVPKFYAIAEVYLHKKMKPRHKMIDLQFCFVLISFQFYPVAQYFVIISHPAFIKKYLIRSLKPSPVKPKSCLGMSNL